MRLISELRRRNVPRMAMLYAAAAWVVMQVAEVIFGLVGLPEQFGRVLLIILTIGFPIALVASWFFELTPQGLALDADGSEGGGITPFGGRRMDFVIIAVLSAALLTFAYDKWWDTGPDDLSIAVLPFTNMSADPEQQYFADGMSEETLNLLAQIRPLKVIARTSSFSFKNKNADVATIAEQLNVRHVLEGSVRTDGDRVRITAQLIDTEDSTHLWSQTYDRDYSAENLFDIQSQVARSIANHLRITLTEPEEARLVTAPTENTEAYAAYLLGRDRLRDRKVAGLAEAVEQFARAVKLDPDFAGAYSGLVDACRLHYTFSGGHVHPTCPPNENENYDEDLLPLARKALALDENLGEAWISLATTLERKEAKAAFERGLSLNPSYTQGYLSYANFLSRPGRYESWDSWLEAWRADTWQSLIKRGLEVDPLSITLHDRSTDHPMWVRTKDEALYHARRIIEIAPDSPRGYATLSKLSWMLSGRIDESIRWANKAIEIDPRHPVYAIQTAYAYATLGDVNMAMAYWKRAGQLISDDVSYGRFHILHALILLGDKDSIPMQQVFDVLKPIDAGNIKRLEIEANLAMINGEAREWLDGHAEYLSECMNAPIDIDYMNKWPKCAVWVDGLLLAAGKKSRARAIARERIEWDQKWAEWADNPAGDPRPFVILGEEDKALDAFEKDLASYRGNPYMGRLYLVESLRFMLHHDPLLGPIRGHPRFQTVVAEVEADLAQQLENVREMERKGELPTLEEVRAGLSGD